VPFSSSKLISVFIIDYKLVSRVSSATFSYLKIPQETGFDFIEHSRSWDLE
jgi:hypothetical protein